jgi:hypothetical protein
MGAVGNSVSLHAKSNNQSSLVHPYIVFQLLVGPNQLLKQQHSSTKNV